MATKQSKKKSFWIAASGINSILAMTKSKRHLSLRGACNASNEAIQKKLAPIIGVLKKLYD